MAIYKNRPCLICGGDSWPKEIKETEPFRVGVSIKTITKLTEEKK